MSTRSTPFGLFAGYSVGRISGQSTSLHLCNVDEYKPVTTLALSFLREVASNIEESHFASLRLRRNPTLVLRRGHWQYAGLKAGACSSFYEAEAENEPVLSRLLDNAANPITVPDLRRQLNCFTRGTYSAEEIDAYIRQLVRESILVSELQPSSSGDACSQLLAKLETMPSTEDIQLWLRELLSRAQHLGYARAPDIGEIEEVCQLARKHVPTVHHISDVIHVDLKKPSVGLRIDEGTCERLLEAVGFVRTLRTTSGDSPRLLDIFKTRFEQRYGETWQPLKHVLSEGGGIGLSSADFRESTSTLLEGLASATDVEETTTRLNDFQKRLLSSLIRRQDRHAPLELDTVFTDAQYAVDLPPLPDAFFVSVSLFSSPDALPLCVLNAGNGPPSFGTIARLAVHDADLASELQTLAAHEESHLPDAVFASVSFLPPDRSANVCNTPEIRDYQLVVWGGASSNAREIPLDDLFVTVHENQVLLYSQSVGKRIIPRIDSSHYFSRNAWPDIYRFLGLLQFEPNLTFPRIELGWLPSLIPIPRLTYKGIVLSLATWLVSYDDVWNDGRSSSSDSGREQWNEFCKREAIPRWISLVDGDNRATFDLDSNLCVDSLLQLMRRTERVVLQEVFPPMELSAASDSRGTFTSESLIPFYRVRHDQSSLRLLFPTPDFANHQIVRARWIHFEIFTFSPRTEVMLLDATFRHIARLEESQSVSRWFFVRYDDPSPHLRVRIEVSDEAFMGTVFEDTTGLFNELLQDGIIKHFTHGTYKPEFMRYGGMNGVSLAESIFHLDSNAFRELHGDARFRDDSENHALYALYMLHTYYDDFARDLLTRRKLSLSIREHLSKEQRLNDASIGVLNNKYREYKAGLLSLVEGRSTLPASELMFKVCTKRSIKLRSLLMQNAVIPPTFTDQETPEAFVADIMHMSINRFFSFHHRLNELVLHSILSAYYGGRLAQDRKSLGHAIHRS